MKFTLVPLLILCLLSSLPIAAQTGRGVGVKIKNQRTGKVDEVKLYDGSYALVIGEVNYTNGWDTLPGVKTDISEITRVLTANGFTVEPEINLTSETLGPRITRFINDYGYEPNNRVLIYFAGHGHTQKSGDGRDLGYIIPVDAPLPDKDPLGFRRQAMTMDTIQNYARQIEAKHALFVFDSCFSGKLIARDKITIPPFIEESVAYPVRQFITAGAASQSVPDDSIFRKSFVRGLEGEADLNQDGYITGSELADYLKEKVTNASGRRQTPQYGKIQDIDLERGDFVFVSPIRAKAEMSGGVPTDQPRINSNSGSSESAFWQMIENSTDSHDFESYLGRVERGEFGGTFKATAELKLYRLRKNSAAAVWKQFSATARKLLDFDEVSLFAGDLTLVRNDLKSGFIDRTGKIVIEPKYDDALAFSEGLAAVKIGDYSTGKWGFIDSTGKQVIPFKYYDVKSFSEKKAAVSIGNWGKPHYWGYIDASGKVLIPLTYSEADSFAGYAAPVSKKGNSFTYIDDQSNTRFSVKYSLALAYSEGLAQVRYAAENDPPLKARWGYINESGIDVIPTKFSEAKKFSEGLAAVAAGDQRLWGYINKNGQEVIRFKYESAENFVGGLAVVSMVKSEVKYGVIDRNGAEVIPLKYDSIWCYAFQNNGIFGVTLDGKKGFVDIYGNEYFDIEN